MIEEGKCYYVVLKDDETNKTDLYTIYVNYLYKYKYHDQDIAHCDIIDNIGNLYKNQHIPIENILHYNKLSYEYCENIFKKDLFERYFKSIKEIERQNLLEYS
mgnify:CR=1 FL=1